MCEQETRSGGVRTEREEERKERSRMRETEMKTERAKRGRPKGCGVHDHFAWLHCD